MSYHGNKVGVTDKQTDKRKTDTLTKVKFLCDGGKKTLSSYYEQENPLHHPKKMWTESTFRIPAQDKEHTMIHTN